jgi:hypothetical protein
MENKSERMQNINQKFNNGWIRSLIRFDSVLFSLMHNRRNTYKEEYEQRATFIKKQHTNKKRSEKMKIHLQKYSK